MRRSVIYAAPIALFLGLIGVFFSRIDADPGEIPFVLLNTPLPKFQLAGVPGTEAGLSSDDVTGRVSLINVFASWCAACLYEHPTFMTLKDEEDLPLYGINW
ncbi:MAG: DsbE family thiol:disulfide interchange protein, partial [Bacteroidetes bacterium]|nr:DsbE family thiol:disulfide interchange protein [Bacteroidota bacterium]